MQLNELNAIKCECDLTFFPHQSHLITLDPPAPSNQPRAVSRSARAGEPVDQNFQAGLNRLELLIKIELLIKKLLRLSTLLTVWMALNNKRIY